jgi:simple sugar transport system permease protein
VNRLRELVRDMGLPRVILVVFVFVLFGLAARMEISTAGLASDALVRSGRNALLVLSLVPMVRGGLGLNFGLPLGVLCGLFGMLCVMEAGMSGLSALLVAAVVTAPIAFIAGWLYGLLLNRVRGQEMMVGTYVGFSSVALMCIFWLIVPFTSPKMIWALGGRGLRTTLDVPDGTKKVLDRSLAVHVVRFNPVADAPKEIVPRRVLVVELVPFAPSKCLVVSTAGLKLKPLPSAEDNATRLSGAEGGDEEGVSWVLSFPTGLVITILLACAVMAAFFRTPMGLAIHSAGANPMFARSSGVNDARTRVWAAALSTMVAGLGILVYTQSFGLVQLYTAPLLMAFPAVAALLIGGATARVATMGQVLVGSLLFNTLLTIALPVINAIIAGDLSEPFQSVVTNGMILYALTRDGEAKK